ncbi:MAG: cation:proton antiporter [Thermoplasmata archaeon]
MAADAIQAIEVAEDLAIVMVVALAMALVCYWTRQPFVIGYIIAGVIVGPYTPPFALLLQPDVLSILAQVGVVFLLFAVGLEYPLTRFRSIGRQAIFIALVQSLGTFAAGYFVGRLFGFAEFDSLFLGLAVSVTSTIILSKVLEEAGVLQNEIAALVIGITVIEDVIVISVLGILQSVAATGSLSIFTTVGTVALVIVFIGGALALGSRTVPWLVDALSGTHRTDLLLIGVLGIAFGLSFLANLIGLSVATGAFLAGVLAAESGSQRSLHELVAPFKEVFGAIFFVSVGALMDIEILPLYLLPIAAFLATSFTAKWVLTYVAARIEKVDRAAARRTALCVSAAGGEVALVVATTGSESGVTSAFVLPMIGAVTIVATFIAPYLVRYAWSTPPTPRTAAPPSSAGPGAEP